MNVKSKDELCASYEIASPLEHVGQRSNVNNPCDKLDRPWQGEGYMLLLPRPIQLIRLRVVIAVPWTPTRAEYQSGRDWTPRRGHQGDQGHPAQDFPPTGGPAPAGLYWAVSCTGLGDQLCGCRGRGRKGCTGNARDNHVRALWKGRALGTPRVSAGRPTLKRSQWGEVFWLPEDWAL